MSETNKLIEAYLLWRNEPVSIKKIGEVFKISITEVESEIRILKERLLGGIVILEVNNEVMLGTSPEASSLIETLTKEDLRKELSKAALETLSIILYKNPVKRSEIDYIRGVNSQFILRNLEMRGLVEKKQSDDGRANVYLPAFELLTHLGIKNVEELPEYNILREAVQNFEKPSEVSSLAGAEQDQDVNTENALS